MWNIYKVFIEFVTILFLFYILGCSFGCEEYGILVPGLGVEPTTPVLEGKVLTTRPPGKFLLIVFESVTWIIFNYSQQKTKNKKKEEIKIILLTFKNI